LLKEDVCTFYLERVKSSASLSAYFPHNSSAAPVITRVKTQAPPTIYLTKKGKSRMHSETQLLAPAPAEAIKTLDEPLMTVAEAKRKSIEGSAFLKVKIEPDDQLFRPGLRYQRFWHLYLVHKEYTTEMLPSLMNLFPAFLIADATESFGTRTRTATDDAYADNIEKLKTLFRTHNIVLPITRFRVPPAASGKPLDVTFLGMMPLQYRYASEQARWDAYRCQLKYTYLYGHLDSPDHASIADVRSAIASRGKYAHDRIFPKLANKRTHAHELYTQHRDALEAIATGIVNQIGGSPNEN